MRRVLKAGDTLRLSCPVESPPPEPLFTWLKDGDQVHVGWDRYRINSDMLRVRDVEPADSGVFICRATNGFGLLDVKYLVYVYGMM
jgi:Immunoglobulin domain